MDFKERIFGSTFIVVVGMVRRLLWHILGDDIKPFVGGVKVWELCPFLYCII